MITKLNAAKETVAKMTALVGRYSRVLEQRELALDEDMAARKQLMDPSLPSDEFTKITNLARSAQRRRANLHDKVIEIEESVRSLATELQKVALELTTEPMPKPLPADAAAVADQVFLDADAPQDEVVAAEGFVETEEEEAA